MKPVLPANLPIEDRMVIACLYRIYVDARRRRDRGAQVKAERALSAAVAAAEGVLS